MECPKCGYEPSLGEIQNSPEQCVNCGVYFSKLRGQQSSAVGARPSEPRNSSNEWKNLASKVSPKILGIFMLGLFLGYFAGREHLKYEMRTALQDSFSSIGAMFGGNKENSERVEVKSPLKPSPIAVTLVSKNFSEEQFSEAFEIVLQFNNKTGKDVRAFDGTLVFNDLLGNEILSSGIAVNDALSKGGDLIWSGSIDYNQFKQTHKAFRAAKAEDINMLFVLSKVLFVDGELKEY